MKTLPIIILAALIKDVADFLESEAKKAVESYFAKPTT
jgi:hypothetical protein